MHAVRRRLLASLCLAAWSLAARGQASGVVRLGYLAPNTAAQGRNLLEAFRQGLNEHGWIDGRNVVIEPRYADGRVDRIASLAAELVRAKVDLIVAGSSVAALAASAATRSIPIVMTSSADAVGEGLVASLARPGGNVTGMTFLVGPEIASKQLQLLKECAPSTSRVAVLASRLNRVHADYLRELKARATGVQLHDVQVSSAEQLESAFASMAHLRVNGLLVLTDSSFWGQRQRIVGLAAQAGLPALYSQREFVDAGGLASYGPSLLDMFRRAAGHVDKILRGGKPGDIPVEQPTRFELVVNLKTAKALGLALPQALRLRADQLIE
jgi:putative tryptophan/tyrosine transport system substrate-binding protein